MLLLAPAVGAAPPNILLIVLDDLGIEHIAEYDYQDGPDPIYAPMDLLAERFASPTESWALFERAWSNPWCSPTRSTIHTGRYGMATGTGYLIRYPESHILDTSDPNLLAKTLNHLDGDDSYQTAAFGKWHLGVPESGADDTPIEAGFESFAGTLFRYNFPERPDSYIDYSWTTVSTTQSAATERLCRNSPPTDPLCEVIGDEFYLTVDTVQAAIDWVQEADLEARPWFAYVALHAPHKPFRCPPDEVYLDQVNGEPAGCNDPVPGDLDGYHGLLSVADEQIDRLLNLTEVDNTSSGDTYVFVLGDNGTPPFPDLVKSPVKLERSKTTVFEGGVRVPLFVSGPTVADGLVPPDFFVNVSDIYMTILELAGIATNPHSEEWERRHSQSFLPYAETDPPEARIRDCIYTEVFRPNGLPPRDEENKIAIAGITASSAGDVYKLIQDINGTAVNLYNLSHPDGEWEDVDLLPCDGPCMNHELEIVSELLACRDTFSAECTLQGLDDPCRFDSDCCDGLFCNTTRSAHVCAPL